MLIGLNALYLVEGSASLVCISYCSSFRSTFAAHIGMVAMSARWPGQLEEVFGMEVEARCSWEVAIYSNGVYGTGNGVSNGARRAV